jgi:hypothetical protein
VGSVLQRTVELESGLESDHSSPKCKQPPSKATNPPGVGGSDRKSSRSVLLGLCGVQDRAAGLSFTPALATVQGEWMVSVPKLIGIWGSG